MARPINADAQATQAKILATAYDLFASHGIDGASIRDIARGAGVSLAMVHHYFGSKQGLYTACIQAMLTELGGLGKELQGMLGKGETDPPAIMAEAVRLGFRYAKAHRTAVRLLQRSLVDTGEIDARVREENMVPFLDTVSEVLGGLTSRPARTLRLPIQSAIFLVVRWAITSEREIGQLAGDAAKLHKPRNNMSAPLAAIEDHLVDATLRLLGMPPPPEPNLN
jgi:AcrR family transcriptional regulator